MKKLILIVLLLATSASAYRLHVVYSVGSGISCTGVRTVITRGNGNTVSSVKDSTITTTINAANTNVEKNWYVPDSLVSYAVTKMYFCGADTFIETVDNVLPIEFEQLMRGFQKEVTDSLHGNLWATAGTVTLSDADIDSIVAGVIAGTTAANGSGIFAANIYARDTVNSSFVSGINIVAVSGATYLFATTDPTGKATFNVDSATWVFNAAGMPYTWVPFTRAVGGNITDTINGGGPLVLPTSNPDMCTIYGVIDRNGAPAVGAWVEITLTRPDTLTIDTSFVELKTRVVTNSLGVWQADVYYLSGSTRNFYYSYKDAYGRILYFRPTASGSFNVRSILIDKP